MVISNYPTAVLKLHFSSVKEVELHFRLKNKRFNGEVVGMLFMIEAVFRYLIEYVRYYEEAMHVHILGMDPTYNHLISISLFILGLIIYIVQYNKYKSSLSESSL